MKRVLRRAGERLAALVVPKVDAGACVPEAGQCCTRRNYRFNCYGACKYSLTC
ncbi:hypothetical protein [Actinophytocola sp. KF-1]